MMAVRPFGPVRRVEPAGRPARPWIGRGRFVVSIDAYIVGPGASHGVVAGGVGLGVGAGVGNGVGAGVGLGVGIGVKHSGGKK